MPPFARHVPVIAGSSVFNPATLSLTGWWRANSSTTEGYNSATGTWDGVASAGGSGSRDLTEATNMPTAGTAVNGNTPPDFDGTNQRLASATAISTYLTASAWFGWWLIDVDAITANSATSYLNDCVMDDSGAFWGIFLRNNAGARTIYAYQWDGAEKSASIGSIALGYNLICARYDGTNIRLRVNSSSVVTGAAGSISTTTGTLRAGYNVATAFNGRMLDVGLMASAGTDANFDDIRNYCLARYGAIGI